MTKGRLAYIEGRLASRTWEGADGAKRRTVEVIADKFQALSPKSAPMVPAAWAAGTRPLSRLSSSPLGVGESDSAP